MQLTYSQLPMIRFPNPTQLHYTITSQMFPSVSFPACFTKHIMFQMKPDLSYSMSITEIWIYASKTHTIHDGLFMTGVENMCLQHEQIQSCVGAQAEPSSSTE